MRTLNVARPDQSVLSPTFRLEKDLLYQITNHIQTSIGENVPLKKNFSLTYSHGRKNTFSVEKGTRERRDAASQIFEVTVIY